MKKIKLINVATILTLFALATPISANASTFNLMDYLKQKYSELMLDTDETTLESGTKRPDRGSSDANSGNTQLDKGPLMTQRSGTKRPDK